jgi:hypothetical protein
MTRRCCSLPSLLILFAGAGCGSDGASDNSDGSNPGGRTEETSGCNPIARVNLAWSERSTLGFSADELLNTLGAEHQSRLTYPDGTSTTLTLALERTSSQVEFQERDYTSDQSGREPAIGTECKDIIAVPVKLTFTTNDGAFADSWSLSLLAESASTATGYVQLDLDTLVGSYTVTEVDPAAFDEVLAFITLDFEAALWSGTVAGQAIESGAGSNGTSSALNFDVGSF